MGKAILFLCFALGVAKANNMKQVLSAYPTPIPADGSPLPTDCTEELWNTYPVWGSFRPHTADNLGHLSNCSRFWRCDSPINGLQRAQLYECPPCNPADPHCQGQHTLMFNINIKNCDYPDALPEHDFFVSGPCECDKCKSCGGKGGHNNQPCDLWNKQNPDSCHYCDGARCVPGCLKNEQCPGEMECKEQKCVCKTNEIEQCNKDEEDSCDVCSECQASVSWTCSPATECCTEKPCSPCHDCINGNCVFRDCGVCAECNLNSDQCEPKDCGECGICKDDDCVDCDELCIEPCSSCEGQKCNIPLECCPEKPCGPCQDCVDGTCVDRDCGVCGCCNSDSDKCEPKDCGECGICKDDECVDCDELCIEPCSTCKEQKCTKPLECCPEKPCGPCQDCVDGTCVDRDCGVCGCCNSDTDKCEPKDCGECGICKDDECVDCDELCIEPCSTCKGQKCNLPLECCPEKPCGPCQDCVDGTCVDRDCGVCGCCNSDTDKCEPKDCGECGICKDDECIDCDELCIEPCSTCIGQKCNIPLECCPEKPCGPCQDCIDGTCVDRDCGVCGCCNSETDKCEQKDCGTCGICKDDKCVDCDELCEPCSTCDGGNCNDPLQCCPEKPCDPCQNCVDGTCVDIDCGDCGVCNPDTDECEKDESQCKPDCGKPDCEHCVGIPGKIGFECQPICDPDDESCCCDDFTCTKFCLDQGKVPNCDCGENKCICTTVGDIVVHRIYVCTDKCDGCDYTDCEGMVLNLVGEETRDGIPKCSTAKLDRPGKTFFPGHCEEFGTSRDDELCAGCFKYPLMGDIEEESTVDWKGKGKWSGSFCVTWLPEKIMHVRCEVEDGELKDCDEVCDCQEDSVVKCQNRVSMRSKKNGGIFEWLN